MPTGVYERPFWARVEKNGPIPPHRPDLGPCWIWLGAKNQYGYGRINQNGRLVVVHRMLYEQTVRKVSRSLTLDHLCRVRSCINPSHLEPVTAKVNSLRGEAPMVLVNRKRVCPRGHTEFYSWKNGHIRCRTCKLESNRRYRENIRKESQAS
jgi:hypothetical protein